MSLEAGAFTPRPGAAPAPRMVAAQAALELRLTVRRGESLLLTLVIPVLLLVVLTTVDVIPLPHPRIDFLTPGVLALAVMSTAFTGQAIATGYERQYGVLKRLGATALPRWGLLAGKILAVVAVEIGQLAVLGAVALALGWTPRGSLPAAAGFVVLGTAAFAPLGLLLAGTLRAEATLAGANLLWFLFLVFGGVIFPLDRFGPGIRIALDLLPLAALADGLRTVLHTGAGGVGIAPLRDGVVLLVWALAALVAAATTFRWE